MPEIGEVARVVHYLKKHLAGKTLSAVKVQEDDIIYGKVGTSASAFQRAMSGKKVVDAKQQGKYFWLEMDSPPHPLMHLGMSGWVKFSNDQTASYYKPTKAEEQEWPPRYWKFILETSNSDAVAFTDARRLGRIRLVDVPASEMRNSSPLKENGPDPVIDKDVLTPDWLVQKCRSKRVPIKALLLDQANISGVGNWVGDEVLYHASIHPEQYSNTLSDAQLAQLHKSLTYVCNFACENLSDSAKFPEDWLFKHRWGKGKRASNTLPSGEKIVFMTVGGRTSAVVPSRQRKTGPVAGDIDEHSSPEPDASEKQQTKEEIKAEDKKTNIKAKPGKRKSVAVADDTRTEEKPKAAKKAKHVPPTKNGTQAAEGKRRSARLSTS